MEKRASPSPWKLKGIKDRTNSVMDSPDWDNSTTTRGDNSSILSCLWSNQYDNSSGDYSNISEKVEQGQAFSTSGLELQGVQEGSEMSSNFDRVNKMVEMLAPPTLNPTNNSLDLNFFQHQEAIRLEVGATWGAALSSRFCSSLPPITRTKAVDPFDSLAENFGSSKELRALSGLSNGKEGLSTIFSGSENIHNLIYGGNISSGESENNVSYNHHRLNWDEVASVSQGRSNSNRDQTQPTGFPKPDETHDAEQAEGKPITKRKLENQYFCNLHRLNSLTMEGGLQISFRNGPRSKQPRSEKHSEVPSINFSQESDCEPDTEVISRAKEMIYRAATLRPVNLGLGVDEALVEKPKRKNMRFSSDPQTVAARHRRERIGERLTELKRLVPGGSKLDTASMLDEAANYLKFLRSEVKALEILGNNRLDDTIMSSPCTLPFPTPFSETFPMQHSSIPHPRP